MPDLEMTINGMEPIIACAKMGKWGAWIDTLQDAVTMLKQQEAEIRQLRLALDIVKGTCNGIKVEGSVKRNA